MCAYIAAMAATPSRCASGHAQVVEGTLQQNFVRLMCALDACCASCWQHALVRQMHACCALFQICCTLVLLGCEVPSRCQILFVHTGCVHEGCCVMSSFKVRHCCCVQQIVLKPQVMNLHLQSTSPASTWDLTNKYPAPALLN